MPLCGAQQGARELSLSRCYLGLFCTGRAPLYSFKELDVGRRPLTAIESQTSGARKQSNPGMREESNRRLPWLCP